MNIKAMPLRIFANLFLFLSLACLPAHAVDEFPEAKSLSSKAKTLSRLAAAQLAKQSPDASLQAAELLQQVIQDASFRRLDIETQVQIFTNLSTAYGRCGQFKEQDKLIDSLLEDTSFSRFWVQLKVHHTRSLITQSRIQEAELLFHQLLREPKRRLAHHETKEIIALASCFERYYLDLTSQAEKLYNVKLYNEAALLYRIVFSACQHHRFPQTRSPQCRKAFMGPLCYRLASCYYLAGDFYACKQIAGSYDQHLPNLIIPLFAMACQKEGLYTEAYNAWKKHLLHVPQDTCAKSEAAFCAIKSQQFDAARNLIDPQANKPLSILLAIEEGRYKEAELLIEHAQGSLQATDITYYECLFLRGYSLYKQSIFEQASLFLEQSIIKDAPWSQDALYLLANCYKTLAEKSQNHEEEVYFDRAESCFEELIANTKQGERQHAATVGLIKTLYARYEKTKSSSCNSTTFERTKNLITSAPPEKSYELALLVAQKTNNLQPLISPEYQNEPLYPEALLLYARSSLCTEIKQEILEKAFFKCGGLTGRSAPIIEELAHINPSKTLQLLSALEPKEKETALYHYITCLALYNQEGKEEHFFSLSDRFLEEYNTDPLSLKIKLYKARMFWKKGYYAICYELLSSLPTDFAERDVALFFMARCSERLHKDPKPLYHELFSCHQNSWYAPESYFRYFPEQEYIQGNAEAILHLKRLPAPFHSSPFSAIGHFYIAESIRQDCPQKECPQKNKLACEAISHYEKAIDSAKNQLDDTCMAQMLDQMSLHASYGKAYCTFLAATTSPELENALNKFLTLKPLLEEKGEHALWQECSWQCHQLFILLDDQVKAREELLSLVEYAQKSNCFTTEPLLFAYCKLAKQHIDKKEFTLASKLLESAEKIHEVSEQRELLLRVWIAQSELMQEMLNYDAAMMLLAKVVNDFSASSLRIQAMYKRAELYERKGRPDLAIRQLEACTKKGGEWAEKAKKRLEDLYGLK